MRFAFFRYYLFYLFVYLGDDETIDQTLLVAGRNKQEAVAMVVQRAVQMEIQRQENLMRAVLVRSLFAINHCFLSFRKPRIVEGNLNIFATFTWKLNSVILFCLRGDAGSNDAAYGTSERTVTFFWTS